VFGGTLNEEERVGESVLVEKLGGGDVTSEIWVHFPCNYSVQSLSNHSKNATKASLERHKSHKSFFGGLKEPQKLPWRARNQEKGVFLEPKGSQRRRSVWWPLWMRESVSESQYWKGLGEMSLRRSGSISRTTTMTNHITVNYQYYHSINH
jgi:hypothetical protein